MEWLFICNTDIYKHPFFFSKYIQVINVLYICLIKTLHSRNFTVSILSPTAFNLHVVQLPKQEPIKKHSGSTNT